MPFRFLISHALFPLVLLVAASILLDVYRFDLVVADFLYQLEGNQWFLKKYWLFKDLLHDTGYRLFILTAILLGTASALSFIMPSLFAYRRQLLFVLLTTASSILLIVLLKSISGIDCPWDYQRYGGDQPALPIYQTLFGNGTGHCFPAGHASNGYAWISLYFMALRYRPGWRFQGLLIGLILGLIYGMTQQLRGAHLLSHDLWTLAICWYTPLIGFSLLAYCDRQKIKTQAQTVIS